MSRPPVREVFRRPSLDEVLRAARGFGLGMLLGAMLGLAARPAGRGGA